MPQPPSGTISFLFTDMQGSTRLWEQFPEQMAIAHARHGQIIADCVSRNNGTLVRERGEGDATFSVYHRPVDAVRAALEIQLALLKERWPEETPIRVRIALHTGTAIESSGDYNSVSVNRTARLRSITHGGQTLLSEATYALVRDELPAGVTLQDMGLHRLKDLSRPERVFQLCHPELPSGFPPLLSHEVHSEVLHSPGSRESSPSTFQHSPPGGSSLRPQLGPIVPKLCDRNPQVATFTDCFVTNLNRRAGTPQCYVLHGDEGECHDSLVQRLVSTTIRDVASRKWGEHQAHITLKKLEWAYDGSPGEMQGEIKRNLFLEFDPAYMGEDLSAPALGKLVTGQLSPINVIRHNIYGRRWNPGTLALIQWYLQYWGEMSRLPMAPQFVLFLNVIFSPVAGPRLLDRLRPRQYTKARIQSELQQLANPEAPCFVLREVLPPQEDEVAEWFKRYDICDAKTTGEIVSRLFRMGARPVAMAEIEHELHRVHSQQLQQPTTERVYA